MEYFLKTALRELLQTYRRMAGITTEEVSARFHRRRSKALISEYLAKHKKKSLQIGCQSHPISGWLNVDLLPKDKSIVYMDATRPFPFPDQTFDFIFTEHMIEHIAFHEAQNMVKECFRVLKKEGRIRIVTPNLRFLIDLYQKERSPTQEEYILFSKRYLKHNEPLIDTVVINNFFRDWGHQFIHDEKSLRYILTEVGFSNIILPKIYTSEIIDLQNLEKHALEITDEFNQLESFVMEAQRL